jgi:ankyrin repeat protein
MEAVSTGHEGLVKTLMDHGAQPGLKDKQGRSALDIAQKKGNAKALAILQGKK